MAESRTGTGGGRREAFPDGGGRLAGSVFWVAAVAGTLLLGLALRTEPPAAEPAGSTPSGPLRPASSPDSRPTAPPPSADVPPRGEPRPPAAPAVLAGPASRMAERAMRDGRRLATGADGWTAQIAVLCDPAGAESLVSRGGDDPRLYLIPAEVDGRSCFRVLWGRFADERAARSAQVPAGLRAGSKPAPRRLAEVLP